MGLYNIWALTIVMALCQLLHTLFMSICCGSLVQLYVGAVWADFSQNGLTGEAKACESKIYDFTRLLVQFCLILCKTVEAK